MRTFSVNWDYRCPFARNAHEHVLDGLAAGAPWDVTFTPFSLGQMHVAEGEPPIWDRPDDDSGLTALQVGAATRELAPERFRAVHRDVFAIRHDRGGDLRDRAALRAVMDEHGVDADAVFAYVDGAHALKVVRLEHDNAVRDHNAWGVPTFVSGDRAVFVRLMERPGGDADKAVRTVERVLDLLDDFAGLNEFKHTSIPR